MATDYESISRRFGETFDRKAGPAPAQLFDLVWNKKVSIVRSGDVDAVLAPTRDELIRVCPAARGPAFGSRRTFGPGRVVAWIYEAAAQEVLVVGEEARDHHVEAALVAALAWVW